MNIQNELMDMVWLLNAASNSAFETKELYVEFLRRRQDFLAIRQSIAEDKPRDDYLEQEINRNLEGLEVLRSCLREASGLLRLDGMEVEVDE